MKPFFFSETVIFQEIYERIAEVDRNDISRFLILKECERSDNVYDYNSRLNLTPMHYPKTKSKVKPRRPGTLDPKPKVSLQISSEDSRFLFDFQNVRHKHFDRRRNSFY